MEFKVLSLARIQKFENECNTPHLLIRYKTPGLEYLPLVTNFHCISVLEFYCHDIENPLSEYNKKIMKEYPEFYKTELVHFPQDGGKRILAFISKHMIDQPRLIVCQCDAGISRSRATAAALAKIFNGDDEEFFQMSSLPMNSTIRKSILDANYD